jgi:hypothetical protein
MHVMEFAEDAQGIATATVDLLTDSTRRAELSRAGQEEIRHLPTWDEAAETLFAAWRAAAGSRLDV